MNAKLWAVRTELANALPGADIALTITSSQYRFTIDRADEWVTHILAFARPELESCRLDELLDGIQEGQLLEALALAPVAIEITVCSHTVEIAAIQPQRPPAGERETG